MLTGKNLERFFDWLLNNIECAEIPAFLSCVRVAPETGNDAIIKAWNNLPLSMQIGVIQDYADSIGYEIQIYVSMSYPLTYGVVINRIEDDKELFSKPRYTNRDEARKASIKAFDEIVNLQFANSETQKVK